MHCIPSFTSFYLYLNFLHFNWRWWHPTPVLLPGKSHGQRSLVGCSPWGHEELDTTEQLHFHFSLSCIGEGNGNPLQCSTWRIPGMGEPGGLPSMGSCRVRHDWSDLAAAVCEVNVVNTFNSRIFFKEDLFFISKFDLEVFNTRNKLQTSL